MHTSSQQPIATNRYGTVNDLSVSKLPSNAQTCLGNPWGASPHEPLTGDQVQNGKHLDVETERSKTCINDIIESAEHADLCLVAPLGRRPIEDGSL
jgi:hypothetical protein